MCSRAEFFLRLMWCVYLYIYQPGRAVRPVAGSREKIKRAQNETSSASLSPIVQSVNPSNCRVVEMEILIFNSQIPEIRE